MTTQPVYDAQVEHRPQFLDRGLPARDFLTVDDLHALPEDPWWKYELLYGALVLSSDFRSMTWDDLQTFPDDPRWKYELIDGALIVTPNAPGLRHQSCALSLSILFREACPPHLQTVIAPFEYKPENESGMQPDIMIAKRPVGEKLLSHTPLLVVEVLSPRTRQIDLLLKRSTYQEHGVQHYWIVDPVGPSVEALQLVGGQYTVQAEADADAGTRFEVSLPFPVSFDPHDLLDD